MHVVIVGGGTAGWLSALIISKRCPQHKITVVESSKIGIIGAGEGSTGSLTNVLQNNLFDYGCNEQEFIETCDVTPKFGIEFKHWTADKSSFISPIDGSPTGNSTVDYLFLNSVANLPKNKFHIATEQGFITEQQKTTFGMSNNPSAYHFDAHKVGKYFKKVCGEKVSCIDAQVNSVNLNERGFIDSLSLDNDTIIQGDFFIDATGFSQVLMKKLGNKWVSYKKNLPVDRAMPFFIPYKDGEIIKPVTTAWAQNNGWMWDIPTLFRRGCGYVYASDFVDDETAHKELEETIGQEVDPIKVIKFESGRLENAWINNCLAIGLSSAFAEPLEATSIHTTIMQLENFAKFFLKETVDETCIDTEILNYNQETKFMYDLLKDFLVLHYQGGRTDTAFWKHITDGNTLTDFTERLIKMSNYRIPNNGLFPQVKGIAGWPIWSYIFAGLDIITPAMAKQELHLHRLEKHANDQFESFYAHLNMLTSRMQENTHEIKTRQKRVIQK